MIPVTISVLVLSVHLDHMSAYTNPPKTVFREHDKPNLSNRLVPKHMSFYQKVSTLSTCFML
ncbi:uncharacterized protein Dmoj_GI26286, isoform C [Drosophila mojavensis]|uniref:Uncharacterized protein, isoform C n=1 Tax=Drosophila mojavensis TaxID=7230 RepID=A0A0Q9XUI8_DROMO|nr:uncharacterized protein Dmoj_GI26286, isoform C [Drosophila mojavensis]